MPERPTSWRTFPRAHWGAISGAGFFTTEVWTWRGLVTYYTLFVIDLASRRVQIVGSTPHPDEMFMHTERMTAFKGSTRREVRRLPGQIRRTRITPPSAFDIARYSVAAIDTN